MTPQEHLMHAEHLLADLEAGKAPARGLGTPDLVVRAANAHITLALALNAVPLIGEAGDELRRMREEDAASRFLDDPSTGTRRTRPHRDALHERDHA
jgi:hypothetical protein